MTPVTTVRRGQVIEVNRQDSLVELCRVASDLYRKRLWPQSETLYRYILNARPEYTTALNNLAVIRGAQNDLAEAESLQRQSVSLAPEDPALRANLATTLLDMGRFEDAEAEFRSALRLDPENKHVNFSLGILLLRQGRFAEAWPYYLKHKTPDRYAFANQAVSYWAGEDLTGKSLLILDEQGLGEAFQIATFFPGLLGTCKSVTLACDPRIRELMERSFPGLKTVRHKDMPALRSALKQADHVCFLTHLTAHLAPDARPPLTRGGHLKPDPEMVERLKKRYRRKFPGKRLIGFSWSTMSTFKQSARTIPLEDWQPLLARPECRFFNLQYGASASSVDTTARELGVSIETDAEIDARNDIDGLAAQICALDQVISIDNTTVHLAASLGRPVWTLLMKYPHWLWGLEGRRPYWYPSMRLFRQETHGEWGPVLEAANAALDRTRRGSRIYVPYQGRLRTAR